jgi:hypothetical protein
MDECCELPKSIYTRILIKYGRTVQVDRFEIKTSKLEKGSEKESIDPVYNNEVFLYFSSFYFII